MVKCSNCNSEVEKGNFCGKCGAKLHDEVKTSDIKAGPKNDDNGRHTKFCNNCGEKIDINAVICPKCGVKIASINEKSPILAAVLSFFIVGLGQVYNGQIKKGVILFIAEIISGLLFIIFIGVVLCLIIWVYGMYDAYRSAQDINNGVI